MVDTYELEYLSFSLSCVPFGECLQTYKGYDMGKLTSSNIVYSKVTEIYYKLVDGVLYRYPTYANAEPGWAKSGYSKDFRGSNWSVVTQAQFLKHTQPKPKPTERTISDQARRR